MHHLWLSTARDKSPEQRAELVFPKLPVAVEVQQREGALQQLILLRSNLSRRCTRVCSETCPGPGEDMGPSTHQSLQQDKHADTLRKAHKHSSDGTHTRNASLQLYSLVTYSYSKHAVCSTLVLERGQTPPPEFALKLLSASAPRRISPVDRAAASLD